jgi:hypothetical protein
MQFENFHMGKLALGELFQFLTKSRLKYQNASTKLIIKLAIKYSKENYPRTDFLL